MRVRGVGELANHDTYWHLVYDDCGHVQAFAREGLDDPDGAAVYARRHYAQGLTCTLLNRPAAAETQNVGGDQFRLVLSLDELAVTITALRAVDRAELAEQLHASCARSGRAPYCARRPRASSTSAQ
jgi:hypothetical protein